MAGRILERRDRHRVPRALGDHRAHRHRHHRDGRAMSTGRYLGSRRDDRRWVTGLTGSVIVPLLHYRRDEAVPTLRDSLNRLRPEKFSQNRDMNTQIRLFDEGVGPDPREQLLLRHEPSGVSTSASSRWDTFGVMATGASLCSSARCPGWRQNDAKR